MLSGLVFLAAIVAFGLVMLWSVASDAPGVRGGTSGLFAMKDAADYQSQEQRRWRGGRVSRRFVDRNADDNEA